jgi:hypothetical protein
MDRLIVDNHEQLAHRLADQPAQKIKKDRRLEGPSSAMKRSLPRLLRLEIIDCEKRFADRRMTRVSSGGKAAAIVGLMGQAGLVGPVDFAALRPGPAGNRRIGALQPLPNRPLPPLGGPTHRPLRGEAPAPQIIADYR